MARSIGYSIFHSRLWLSLAVVALFAVLAQATSDKAATGELTVPQIEEKLQVTMRTTENIPAIYIYMDDLTRVFSSRNAPWFNRLMRRSLPALLKQPA